MQSKLYPLEQVVKFIESGKLLSLAGDEKVMSKLPKGNWIGGTIPYFMDIDEGKFDQDQIFVNDLLNLKGIFKIKTYDSSTIDQLAKDAFENGFTILIVPPFQGIHQSFALKAPSIEGIFKNPVIGWIAGVDLNSKDTPRVYDGSTLKCYEADAIALHVKLPESKLAHLDIVNIFTQDENSVSIQFLNDGFECTDCLINGELTNFAEYIQTHNINIKTPIVANYSGAKINVSFKEIIYEQDKVIFYAPIFKDTTYKFALPVEDYVTEFASKIPEIEDKLEFSCNCILNFVYGDLENKTIKDFTGPITFGEIGYQLLNQTLTYMTITDK